MKRNTSGGHVARSTYVLQAGVLAPRRGRQKMRYHNYILPGIIYQVPGNMPENLLKKQSAFRRLKSVLSTTSTANIKRCLKTKSHLRRKRHTQRATRLPVVVLRTSRLPAPVLLCAKPLSKQIIPSQKKMLRQRNNRSATAY